MDSWSGRCFEDFTVGEQIQHRLGRTVTATDNAWFTLLTLNTNPIHFDAHYAKETRFGRPIVNSCFTLALVTGISVSDISQNAVANLGWDKVELPHPLFEGETVYARSEVIEARPSRSIPEAGIVRVRTTGYADSGAVVIRFERAVLVYRRSHLPAPPVPANAELETWATPAHGDRAG